MAQVFNRLVLPLKFAVLSVLSSRKISVLDNQFIDLLQFIYLRQQIRVRDALLYFQDEMAMAWIEEMKFLINMLITTSMLEVKKVHKVPLSQVFNEIVKND